MALSFPWRKSVWMQGVLLLSLMGMLFSATSWAETRYQRVYDSQTRQYVYVPENQVRSRVTTVLQNPIVKQAAVGAAIGGAAGLFSDKSSVARGIGIGALSGAGTGLIDQSDTLHDRPLIKSTLKGAVIGTGASTLTRNGAMKGALLGGAAGTGVHLLREYLDQDKTNNGYRY